MGLSCWELQGRKRSRSTFRHGQGSYRRLGFLRTTGRRSGKWDKIAVPSNWELQGFGTYNYYTDKENP